MNPRHLAARLSAVVKLTPGVAAATVAAAAAAAEVPPPAWAQRAAQTAAAPVGYNDPYGGGAANGFVEPYGTYDAYTGELLRPVTAPAAPQTAETVSYAPTTPVTPVSASVATGTVTPVGCPTGDCGPRTSVGVPVHRPAYPAPVYHAPAPVVRHVAPTPVYGGSCAPGLACAASAKNGAYVFAQTEAVFLFPINDGLSNDLFCTAFSPTVVENHFGRHSNDFDDLAVAPRLTLGVRNGCWGAAVRYFDLQQGSDLFVPFGAAGQTTTLGVTNLDVYYVDIEAQRYFDFGGADATAFFGARHGQFSSFQSLVNQEEFFGEIFSTSSAAAASFNGTGITFGGQGTRRIGCTDFHLFGGVRGSVLFGNVHHLANAYVHASGTDTNAVGPLGPTGPTPTDPRVSGFSGQSASQDLDDELFILEVQLGGEYRFPIQCLCADAFIRAAFEYQYWGTDGYAAAYAEEGQPNGFASAGAVSDGINLDLIGFVIATGLTW